MSGQGSGASHGKISGTSRRPSYRAGDGADLRDWYEDRIPKQHTRGSGDSDAENRCGGRLMLGMDAADASDDQATTAEGEDHAAGGYEISVEAFDQRQQSGDEDEVDDPARAHGMFEGHCGHEFFIGQFVPGSGECDRRDDNCVEENADENRHPDSFEKCLRAKLGGGFFGGFGDGFESGHEVRDDLHDQQKRNQRGVGKQRWKVTGRSFGEPERDEYDEEGEGAESGPVLKSCAEADATIVQSGQQRGERETDDEVRKINRATGDAVEFERIE